MLAYLWYTLFIVGGLILGSPNGQFIRIDHPTVKQSDIRGDEMFSKAASKCALALLDAFFSKEYLAPSLATKEDKDLLDPDTIEGIRCQVVYMLLILFYLGFIDTVHTVHINYKYPYTTRLRREVGK